MSVRPIPARDLECSAQHSSDMVDRLGEALFALSDSLRESLGNDRLRARYEATVAAFDALADRVADNCGHEETAQNSEPQRSSGMAQENMHLLWLIANLEPLCVNPGDGSPFEDGEVPYIDEARALIRLNYETLLRQAGARFLDDMAAKIGGDA